MTDIEALKAKIEAKGKQFVRELEEAGVQSTFVPETRTTSTKGAHVSIPLSQFGLSSVYAEIDVNELVYHVENDEE